MFERYTPAARKAIFFARYEASQFGDPEIRPEHLLLGILREDAALALAPQEQRPAPDGIGRESDLPAPAN